MAAPQPINERYNEERFSQSITRPAIRNVSVERNSSSTNRAGWNAARTATSLSARGASVVMGTTAKVGKSAGKGATRAGVALSSTGVGAIVGVPLAAVGIGTQAAATGLDVGSKVTRRLAQGVKPRKSSPKKLSLKPKAMSMSGMMEKMLLFNFTAFWFGCLLPMALGGLFFAGLISAVEGWTQDEVPLFDDEGNAILDENGVQKTKTRYIMKVLNAAGEVVSKAADSLAGLASDVTGWDIQGFLGSLSMDFWFGALHSLVMILGIGMMLIVAMYYAMDGKAVLSGRGMLVKKALFLGGIIGYAMPVLNLIPWFLFYALVVKKYPD